MFCGLQSFPRLSIGPNGEEKRTDSFFEVELKLQVVKNKISLSSRVKTKSDDQSNLNVKATFSSQCVFGL